MLLTLFLLGLLYVILVGVLFAAGASGVLIAVIACALLFGQFFVSDKLGLAAMGAKVVTPDQAPGLHAMIERLCIQADLPKPKIAVADTTMPNAFAIGRSQKSATVCATTGLMNMLEPHELEAVMAHELTHVKNRDVMIMTVASFFAALASMIVQFGFFFGGGGEYDDGDDDNPSFMVVLLVSFVVYILSFFLMLALSRYREFAADRGSALITGRPSALSSALLKITSGIERVPQQDLRAAEGMSAFFIVSPALKSSLRTLFMDHPPTEKRIEQLSKLETQLHAGGPGRIAA
ncbi:MAG: heat shock protein HtpX [Thermoleophilaceae bacterium]|nr:heat shock protein HtpX [Thermoleophilaceae bacterium]